jgi:hypothetical protein
MAFPSNNAEIAARLFANNDENAASGHFTLVTGQHNWFSTPGVIDVSGMEIAMSLEQVANTGQTKTTASAASTVVMTLSDGGQEGNATGAAVLVSGDSFSNSLTGSFTINVPIDATGTSTTDLDADDWVNFRALQNASGLVGAVNVTVAYVYGKPGVIN